MRFTDKLIATIKKAYEHYAAHKNRQYLDLKELMNAADIISDYEEVVNLGKRLEGDGLVIFHLKYGKNGTPHIYLTSDGIDKCESGDLFDVETAIVESKKVIEPIKTPELNITESINNNLAQENTGINAVVAGEQVETTSILEPADIEKSNLKTDQLPASIVEIINDSKTLPNLSANISDENKIKAATLLELLQEIKIAASLNEDLRVREVKELMERIEELSVFLKTQNKIPKFGFNDFLLAINEMEPMDNYLPRLEKYLP